MRLGGLIFGRVRLGMDREALESVLGLCARMGISYWGVRIEDGRAEISVYALKARAVEAAARTIGIETARLGEKGLPALLWRGRWRLGIPIGMVLGIALIFLSGRYVWDIRVDGDIRLSEEQVESVLGQCGLSVGTPLSGISAAVIENRVMILSDDIAWISINMRGTVANVEIRESLLTPREEIDCVSNLVSDCDGVVERLEEVRGYQAVNIGDKVKQGQLLVGGIVGDEGTDIGLMAAKGRVYARCERTLEVTAPRKTVRKCYEGEVKCEKYLIFFKKEIKFFTNYRNSPTTCDKIDTVEYLRAPDGSRLPIGIRTVRYMEYTQEETERSDAELNGIADYMLAAELTALLADGELLSRSVERELDEEACRIVCRITCVRNIAQRKEIEISEDG